MNLKHTWNGERSIRIKDKIPHNLKYKKKEIDTLKEVIPTIEAINLKKLSLKEKSRGKQFLKIESP